MLIVPSIKQTIAHDSTGPLRGARHPSQASEEQLVSEHKVKRINGSSTSAPLPLTLRADVALAADGPTPRQ